MSASIETLQLLALLVESAPEHAVKYSSKFCAVLAAQNLEISSPELIDRLIATAECGRAFFSILDTEHHSVAVAWLRRALVEFRGERNLLEHVMRALHAFFTNPGVCSENCKLRSIAVALAAVELELFFDEEISSDGLLAACCAVLAEVARNPGDSAGLVKKLWLLVLRGFSAGNFLTSKFACAAADFLAAGADEEYSGEISRLFAMAVKDNLEISSRLLPSLKVVDPVEWTSESEIVDYLYKSPTPFSDWLLVSALTNPAVSLAACLPTFAAPQNNWKPAVATAPVLQLAPELDDFARPEIFGAGAEWAEWCSSKGMVEAAVALVWRGRAKCMQGLLAKFFRKLKSSESAVKLLYMSLPSFPELEIVFCENLKLGNFQVADCPPFSTWVKETIRLNSYIFRRFTISSKSKWPLTPRYSLIFPSPARRLVASSSTSTLTLFPRPLRTSALFALVKRVVTSLTRDAHSIV